MKAAASPLDRPVGERLTWHGSVSGSVEAEVLALARELVNEQRAVDALRAEARSDVARVCRFNSSIFFGRPGFCS